MRKKHILDKMKVTPITEYVNNYKIRLVATCYKNGQGENLLKKLFRHVPIGRLLPGRPKRKPLGLMLEWKIMMMLM
jgi:hypothetical protein